MTTTGSDALALGALDAGVHFVTGYPGSPSTATFEALLRLSTEAHAPRLEWAINEKSALDAAIGASLANARALVCLKSVGLNVALDSLMVANLATGPGALVILAGDDPGGWGSQNEEDSRLLAAAAEVPLIEPTSAAAAREVMVRAFALSEAHRVPVVVRLTRALAVEPVGGLAPATLRLAARPIAFSPEPDRFNVLPVHVVSMHRRLQATLARVRVLYERSDLNQEEGAGRRGVLAAGHAWQKVISILNAAGSPPLRVLGLATLHPLPEELLTRWMADLDAVLVVEETMPYVETQLQALACRSGRLVPILGRSTGHLPGAGELSAPDVAAALVRLLPDWTWPTFEAPARTMPSRQALCPDCPYVPALDTLLSVMARHGGRDRFVITGETGCMVRAQLPPWEILDAKYGMGGSIGLAAGLVRAGIPQHLIALSGDSALLHSGFGELIDAVQAGVDLLVMLLENQTTALSGCQPHPATPRDARGVSRPAVDLEALVRVAGATTTVVNPRDTHSLAAALDRALVTPGVSVVIAREPCPRDNRNQLAAE
ncbi:MAG: hypothetical protein JXA93_10205 [Anaerolineae bacterium]|nr:hypothetical protein [Anaerolineae bacterium]